jgi:hypothetical protein
MNIKKLQEGVQYYVDKDSKFAPLKCGTKYSEIFLIVWHTYHMLLLFLKVQIMSILTAALMRIKWDVYL